MSDSRTINTLYGVQCCCNILVLVFGILIVVDIYTANKYTSRDLNSVTQITDDWEQMPFVEIEIKNQPCELFGMQPVFERLWRGTTDGCYENYWFSDDEVLTYDQWQKKSGEDDTCDEIHAIQPISQIIFYNNFFCGQLGGKPFSTVKRVNPETGLCPDGLESCSSKTSPANTVCYLPEDHPTSCPITDMKIVETSDVATYQNDTAYTVKSFTDRYQTQRYLVYSKDVEDSLPIVSTAIEGGEPCMHPNERTDLSAVTILYPLENENFVHFCQPDQNNNQITDPRYYWTGGLVHEYEVQQDSGVLNTLMALPLYTQYVGPNFVQKKMNIDYKIWARPTIPWKLECEATKPRGPIFQTMITARENEAGATRGNTWIYWVAGILLIGLPIIGAGVLTCCGFSIEEKSVYIFIVIAMNALMIGGAVWCMYLSKQGVERISNKWDSITKMAGINGCTDEYTFIPIQAIQYEYGEGKKYEQLVVTFSQVIIGLGLVPKTPKPQKPKRK